MKLNLLYDRPNDLPGLIGVNPFDVNADICCDLENLYFCENGEVEEIVCNDVLSYYHQEQSNKMLQHFISKLAYGGTISVTDLNVYELTRQFTLGKITLEEFNSHLSGVHGRKSLHSPLSIIVAFQGAGLKINLKKIQDFTFTIRGTR